MARRSWLVSLLFVGLLCGAHAQQAVIAVDHGPNAEAQQSKHYVVLVSLDGFRYDYAKKYGARHLLTIAAHGASAPEGMIPSYPSLTFPNHYTLVTGLYPEHHGIVGNSFLRSGAQRAVFVYAIRRRTAMAPGTAGRRCGRWRRSRGCERRAFWPGPRRRSPGERPSYYLHFDNKFPDEKRIDQVIAWLKLPAEQRPHFITLYYANVDHAGHEYGPDSPQTAEAVKQVDALVGKLEEDLKATHLPVDLVIVSDHGMVKIQGSWIDLDKYASMDGVTAVGDYLYAPNEAGCEQGLSKTEGGGCGVHGVSADERAGGAALQQQSARGRSGDCGAGCVCDSPAGAAAGNARIGRPRRAITGSIRT